MCAAHIISPRSAERILWQMTATTMAITSARHSVNSVNKNTQTNKKWILLTHTHTHTENAWNFRNWWQPDHPEYRIVFYSCELWMESMCGDTHLRCCTKRNSCIFAHIGLICTYLLLCRLCHSLWSLLLLHLDFIWLLHLISSPFFFF